jgi:hypothetical protein
MLYMEQLPCHFVKPFRCLCGAVSPLKIGIHFPVDGKCIALYLRFNATSLLRVIMRFLLSDRSPMLRLSQTAATTPGQ